MAKANRVIANSEYVSQRLEDDFEVKSDVIYPPINLDEYKVKHNKQGYIAATNPRNRDKGVDIFLDLVESMPDEQFMCAGVFRDSSFKKRAEELSNINHIGYCNDMREFYTKTQIVLVPSRWNEAFGRSAAEPMASGIPVVVSDRGGLPEVVGETGEVVTNIESVDAWKQAIEAALENHNPESQKERVRRFSAKTQGDKLNRIVSEIIDD
jgi:glycosyltransferase involved in cell wall biosynthesis